MRDYAQKNPIAPRHCGELVYGEPNSRLRGARSGDNNRADEGGRWRHAVE
jgi:hypothetical protein